METVFEGKVVGICPLREDDVAPFYIVGQWHPVLRYDTVHDQSHRDILHFAALIPQDA
jgi:hypothetical protein